MPQQRSRFEVPSRLANPFDLARVLGGVLLGNINVVRPLTIVAYTGETVVQDRDITPNRGAFLSPRSAAAADLKWWVSAKGRGELTISHDEPGVDAEFDLLLIG
jgi:hypothetical protein